MSSQLKVNSISDAAGANGNAITLATDGTCTAKATNRSNKNLVINGSMQCWQRDTGTVITSDGSNEGYTTVDRWQTLFAGSAGGALSTERSTDAPDGFLESVLLKCTTASTSLSGTEHVLYRTKLEGQNLSSLEWGKTSPKSVTLSWYMKAVNPKTLAAQLTTPVGSGRYYLKKFTPTTSWARYTWTIPGDSTALVTNNTEGLAIQFGLSIGSGMQQAADSTAWSGTAKHGVSGQGNFLDSTSNQLFISGVQLEVSDYATDFDHRSVSDELQRCMRYYEVIMAAGAQDYDFMGMWYSGSEFTATIRWAVPKRANPTLVHNTGTNYFQAFGGSVSDQFDTWTGMQKPTPRAGTIYNNNSISGGTTGHGGWCGSANNAAYIHVSAEL